MLENWSKLLLMCILEVQLQNQYLYSCIEFDLISVGLVQLHRVYNWKGSAWLNALLLMSFYLFIYLFLTEE